VFKYLILLLLSVSAVFAYVTCNVCNGSGNGNFPCISCRGVGTVGGVRCLQCNGRRFSPCSACGGRGGR